MYVLLLLPLMMAVELQRLAMRKVLAQLMVPLVSLLSMVGALSLALQRLPTVLKLPLLRPLLSQLLIKSCLCLLMGYT